MSDLTLPLKSLHWVDRDKLTANNYNPNKVMPENLKLLLQSIITNGFTAPIVCRSNYIIIDGFHRWIVAGHEPLTSMLDNKVPVVIVEQKDEDAYIYATITHNRARGQHLLEPMKQIVRQLLDNGKTIAEISKQLGMKAEEIFRLSNFTKYEFLAMMDTAKEYSKAEIITNY